MNKIYLDWEEYGILLKKLVDKLKKEKAIYVGVYPILRGGLPIALYVSHYLKIPIVRRGRPGVLIVDDISDTGKTLEKYKNCTIACLHTTKWTKVKPNFFVAYKLKKDDWIVYPYEDDTN